MAKRSKTLSTLATLGGITALGAVAALSVRAVVRSIRHLDVRDKTVLITGGSRGLGLAMARVLAKKGARLALCARDIDELERTREELALSGATVFVGTCDVTSAEQVQHFVAEAEDWLGPIDVLIANAATIRVGPISALSQEDFEQAMNDTFWGAYHATMAVLPSMRERRAGRIVHIASFGGKVSVPHLAPYSAAKFALVGFSEGLRAELLQDGIYVTTVAPGLLRTGSHVNAEFKGDPPKEFSWFSLGMAARLISMDADRAARQIVTALQAGQAQIILGVPAKLASLVHGIFPGTVADLLARVNEALPADGGVRDAVRGADVLDEAPAASVIRTLDPLVEKFHESPGPFQGQRSA